MKTKTDSRLVSEFYDITDFEIKKLHEQNTPYMDKVFAFWWQIKESPVDRLTPGQTKWLSTIEADLSDNWRQKWMEEEGMECFP
jgi:hypothetical protein